MAPSEALALHWNHIWTVMEAWDRQSDSSALRERLLAAAPPPKRARLTANAVTTFDFTPSETASPRSVPHATRSPRIFSFSKLQAHAGPAFTNGDVACVHGLNGRPDLNGQHCVLTAFHDDAGRWAVRFMSGEEVRVKAANLKHSPATAETLAAEVPSEIASPRPSVPHAAQSPRIFSFSKPHAQGVSSVQARDAATVFSFTSAPTQAPVQHGRGPSPRIYSFGHPRIVAPPACTEPFRFSATTTPAPVPGPAFTFSVPPPKMVAKARVSRRQLRLAASYDWSIGQV